VPHFLFAEPYEPHEPYELYKLYEPKELHEPNELYELLPCGIVFLQGNELYKLSHPCLSAVHVP